MNNFADRLISAIIKKGNPCVVGLDPRLDMMPNFITACCSQLEAEEAIRSAITNFHQMVLDAISPLVPAVKLQIAFYEQYGLPGLQAFADTVRAAKELDLLVIVDAKRNDIDSTARAYANAFLGRSAVFGNDKPIFDLDCMTVSPFLGRDSIEPFINACAKYGKGIFVLVKTSNPGSVDLQDQKLATTGEPLYNYLARMVHDLGRDVVGESGYSSVGAVVGATFPEEAMNLRKLMPTCIFLVPGYGAQGGNAEDAARCFNSDGLGAIVNASRSITYAFGTKDISIDKFNEIVRSQTLEMIKAIKTAIEARRRP